MRPAATSCRVPTASRRARAGHTTSRHLPRRTASRKLVGYVFLSTDIVDIPAYSGKPVVTLIGMDTKGIITGVKVLKHSEPILLLGIPESALTKFIGQYVGKFAGDKSRGRHGDRDSGPCWRRCDQRRDRHGDRREPGDHALAPTKSRKPGRHHPGRSRNRQAKFTDSAEQLSWERSAGRRQRAAAARSSRARSARRERRALYRHVLRLPQRARQSAAAMLGDADVPAPDGAS